MSVVYQWPGVTVLQQKFSNPIAENGMLPQQLDRITIAVSEYANPDTRCRPEYLAGNGIVCSRLDIHKRSATAKTCRQCEKSIRNGTVRSGCSDILFAWLPNRFIRIAGSEMLKCDRRRYMGEALSL
ncbi:hypothetical protein AVEN_67063-1 [Araneus ventricosus]|uniref:Uncharacterized protein n=1 Tax=Araneus ventricosus TaxID=182803 RepID=A0A4Y2U9V2_ARAVE|nr:hypothetical protein AVEN_67063-1 [Araneus ventricosus]